MQLLRHQQQPITAAHITAALQNIGIQHGDTIFVHSSLMHLGTMATPKKSVLLHAITEILQQAVGAQGTIIMPTFTYSFTKNEIFDVKNTPSTVGDLSNFFRKQPDVLRNEQPIFSVAAWGKYQQKILEIGSHTFDEKSIFGIIHRQLNAKILMFGAAFYDHCSFFHYIEYMAGVPYRTPKSFEGTIIKTDGSQYHARTEFTVRDLVKNPIINGTNLKNHLKKQGLFSEIALGAGNIELIHTTPLYDHAYAFIKQNPVYLLQ